MRRVSTEDVLRIYREVVMGVAPPENESPAHAERRRRIRVQVNRIKEQGGVADIPFEFDENG